MIEASIYSAVVGDLWNVVQVLRVTPLDGLLEVTKQLEGTSPDGAVLDGALTPRRLRRDARMLAALQAFQSELRAIDSAPEE